MPKFTVVAEVGLIGSQPARLIDISFGERGYCSSAFQELHHGLLLLSAKEEWHAGDEVCLVRLPPDGAIAAGVVIAALHEDFLAIAISQTEPPGFLVSSSVNNNYVIGDVIGEEDFSPDE